MFYSYRTNYFIALLAYRSKFTYFNLKIGLLQNSSFSWEYRNLVFLLVTPQLITYRTVCWLRRRSDYEVSPRSFSDSGTARKWHWDKSTNCLSNHGHKLVYSYRTAVVTLGSVAAQGRASCISTAQLPTLPGLCTLATHVLPKCIDCPSIKSNYLCLLLLLSLMSSTLKRKLRRCTRWIR